MLSHATMLHVLAVAVLFVLLPWQCLCHPPPSPAPLAARTAHLNANFNGAYAVAGGGRGLEARGNTAGDGHGQHPAANSALHRNPIPL